MDPWGSNRNVNSKSQNGPPQQQLFFEALPVERYSNSPCIGFCLLSLLPLLLPHTASFLYQAIVCFLKPTASYAFPGTLLLSLTVSFQLLLPMPRQIRTSPVALRHQYLLKLSRGFQCATTVENHCTKEQGTCERQAGLKIATLAQNKKI